MPKDESQSSEKQIVCLLSCSIHHRQLTQNYNCRRSCHGSSLRHRWRNKTVGNRPGEGEHFRFCFAPAVTSQPRGPARLSRCRASPSGSARSAGSQRPALTFAEPAAAEDRPRRRPMGPRAARHRPQVRQVAGPRSEAGRLVRVSRNRRQVLCPPDGILFAPAAGVIGRSQPTERALGLVGSTRIRHSEIRRRAAQWPLGRT